MRLGRAGWFAKGVVYAIAGYLAAAITFREWDTSITPGSNGSQEASPTGAINTIAGTTGGSLLLWALAMGMLLYSAWRVTAAVLPGGHGADAMAHRVGYLVSAIVYVTFAVSAISLADDRSSDVNGNTTVTDLSSSVMANTTGRVVIGVIGVIIVAVGLYRLSKGVRFDVTDELDLSNFSVRRTQWMVRLGAVGEVGRGIGIGLVGFFLFRSAMTYDAAEATGLDGALRRTLTHSGGVAVVGVVAVGFAAYGVFCLLTFTRRRLETL
ncbi:MAG: DUF1206 domain-containing protein [Actinomycetota bacterium]|nr:DUF1206 domain-containing protein [Actinomycetota bacterium]